MEFIAETIKKHDSDKFLNNDSNVLLFENESFKNGKKVKGKKKKRRKKYAREILSGPDTASINFGSFTPEKAIYLDRSNIKLVKALDLFLSRNGFSKKYEFNSVNRYANSLGFVVEHGRVAKFLKNDIVRLTKLGESSIFTKYGVFTYLNKIREGINRILRENEITPRERLSRIDIFRDFITNSGIYGVIPKGSLPQRRASADNKGPFMRQRQFYDREDNSRTISGVKFWNTSTSLTAYSKSLESLQKSEGYKKFYDQVELGKNEEIIRLEIKQTSTFALNALYPIFLNAIKEKCPDKMLEKLLLIEVHAFNGFFQTHPFINGSGQRDEYVEEIFKRDEFDVDYKKVEELKMKFSNISFREIFNVPASRDDVIESLTRTFYRLNLDPRNISRGDLAEISSKFKRKKRRRALKEGDVLEAQKNAALLIADPEDVGEIERRFQQAYAELKHHLVV